jgi:hypothetical protein
MGAGWVEGGGHCAMPLHNDVLACETLAGMARTLAWASVTFRVVGMPVTCSVGQLAGPGMPGLKVMP